MGKAPAAEDDSCGDLSACIVVVTVRTDEPLRDQGQSFPFANVLLGRTQATVLPEIQWMHHLAWMMYQTLWKPRPWCSLQMQKQLES